MGFGVVSVAFFGEKPSQVARVWMSFFMLFKGCVSFAWGYLVEHLQEWLTETNAKAVVVAVVITHEFEWLNNDVNVHLAHGHVHIE